MLTETISLIAVVVMAWLLWREHRKRVAVEEDRRAIADSESRAEVRARMNERSYTDLWHEHERVKAQLARLTDRDEKGRFVKRERGEAA